MRQSVVARDGNARFSTFKLTDQQRETLQLKDVYSRARNPRDRRLGRVDVFGETVDVEFHSRFRSTSSAVSIELTRTFRPRNTRSMSATEIVISPAMTSPRLRT